MTVESHNIILNLVFLPEICIMLKTKSIMRTNLIKYTTFFLLLFIIAPLCFPQSQTDKDYDEALRNYRSGFTDHAYRLLVKVVEQDPKNTSALTLLGEIKFAQKKWGDAIDWFEKLLEVKEKSLKAQYYLGICYREQGKYKAFITQRRDWSKARHYFEAVFLKDPTFQDIFYQYAVLQQYKKEYRFAVDRAERQLVYKPTHVASIVGTHQLYDLLLFHKDGAQTRQWLSQQENPRALLYTGESFRRDKQYAQADSIFNYLLESDSINISQVPLYLAKARMSYELEKKPECEKWYHKAVHSIKTPIDAALLFEDLKYVFTDAEYEQYLDTHKITALHIFFKKFWIQRNPMPGAPENIRIIEHFRRLLYCEEYYRYDGVRSWVNSPDKNRHLRYPRVFFLNNKFNDKGLIYVRHGEASEKAVDVAGQNGAMPTRPEDQATVSNESWLYYQRGQQPKRIFHFLISEHATGNNWQLAPILPTNLLEGRLEWDSIFHRMYFAAQENETGELNSLQLEMAQKSKNDVFAALTSDNHSWFETIQPINFPFYISTFRGKNNSTRYEIYYGFEPEQLWPADSLYNEENKVELGFAAYDDNWNEIFKQNKTVTHAEIKQQTDAASLWTDQYVFECIPKEINMNLFVRMPERNGIGGYKFKYGHAIYSVKNLKTSAIILANNITPQETPGPLVKNGLEIISNPALSFSKKKPMHIYFEVYNLKHQNGQAKFDIEYKIKLLKRAHNSLFRRIRGIFGGGQSEISNKLERFSSGETSIEYLALDLKNQTSGTYELTIDVNDNFSNEQAESKIEFQLK